MPRFSPRKQATLTIEERILAALRDAGGTLTRSGVREAIRVPIPATDLDQVTDQLVERGAIVVQHMERPEVGRRSAAHWGKVTVYRLAEVAETPLPFAARPSALPRPVKPRSRRETVAGRARRILEALQAAGGKAPRDQLRNAMRPRVVSTPDFNEAIALLVREGKLTEAKGTTSWRSPRGTNIQMHRTVYTLLPSTAE
jgi:hypothetical protein